MKELITLNTEINTLITTIQDEIVKGKERIEQTIENEKTVTYWNIGKHIHTHLLKHEDRAEYGDSLFKIIAKELRIGERSLYASVQFYETYPKILHARAKLTWSHYRILMTIQDVQKRLEFEKKVIEENLSTRELQDIIRDYKNGNKNKKKKLLKETRGLLNAYRLKPFTETGEPTLYIDLGFRMYINKLEKQTRYKETDIIQDTTKKGRETLIIIEENLQKYLFTYKSYVRQIIDGDTLWVTIDLGFNSRITQKVRLRGINVPKLEIVLYVAAKKAARG
jgi:hypothetical protein